MSIPLVEPHTRPDGFHSLVAIRDVNPGEIVRTLSGPVLPQASQCSIQISESEHVEDDMGIYINHSCSPNACVRGATLQATAHIPKGAEVTFNYNESESQLAHPFVCNCCGRLILGKSFGTKDVFDTGSDKFSIFRRQFNSLGVVYLPNFLSESGLQILLKEKRRLQPYAKDKNFFMPPSDTIRILQTIGGRTVTEHSPTMLTLYEHTRQRLQEMLGIPLYRCYHDQEFIVINHFHRPGAEHGWHMDDPSHVLVMSLAAASPSDGGHVEFVPRVIARTHDAIESAVSSATEEGRINRLFIHTGDAYLIRGDKTLHRVAPIRNAERVVVALSYDDKPNRTYDEWTTDLLYE
jgi:SET domain